MNTGLLRPSVATVPTVYGIETSRYRENWKRNIFFVATVPTVYGIETLKLSHCSNRNLSCNSTYRLRY